jgi:hypothetical protein
VGGQREALSAGREYGVEVVPGIEFSVIEDGRGFHILGYFIDPEDEGIVKSVRWLREKRLLRFEKMLEKLRGLGVEIDMDEIREYADTDAYGRPHLARALLEKGIISDYQQAYSIYIGNGRRAYVAKEVLSMERVITLIRSAGGVPVWAHPGGRAAELPRLKRMIELGLQGLEVWHPNHNYDVEKRMAALAGEFHLVATGGSDFHFEEGMKVDIGGKYAPYSSVERLRELSEIT